MSGLSQRAFVTTSSRRRDPALHYAINKIAWVEGARQASIKQARSQYINDKKLVNHILQLCEEQN